MLFDYPASTITAIHDGDTVTVQIDYGFSLKQTHILRLYGINAPELNTPAGKDALAFLLTLVKIGDVLDMQTIKVKGALGDTDKQEKYGRYLATLYTPGNTVSINQQMINAGHAVPYFGVQFHGKESAS